MKSSSITEKPTTASKTHHHPKTGVAAPEDLMTFQNEALKHSKVQFLHSLQPEASEVFGYKNKPRD